jgi:hypothetical protein
MGRTCSMYEGNDKFIPVPYSYYKISRETPSWENTTRWEDSIKINIGKFILLSSKRKVRLMRSPVCLSVCAP